MIDLRSDTVTAPSKEMRLAMLEAPVGDDVYGEDATVIELEETVAALLGHEAGLYCPTGTMANVLGVWSHTRVGAEVICDSMAHIVRAEMGAHAALAGATMRTWTSTDGRVVADDVLAMVARECGPYLVETACVAVEDTFNFAGGTVQDPEELRKLSEQLADWGIGYHLDGARLPNAAAHTGLELHEYGQLFGTVSICLSKGLGAPVGSVLAGSAEVIAEARVRRKRLGGGWRQAGILAAGGLYALEHNLPRIGRDHDSALAFAKRLTRLCGDAVTLSPVESNIVLIEVPDAAGVAARAQSRGLRISVIGPELVRVVTHLDVSVEDCESAAGILAEILA